MRGARGLHICSNLASGGVYIAHCRQIAGELLPDLYDDKQFKSEGERFVVSLGLPKEGDTYAPILHQVGFTSRIVAKLRVSSYLAFPSLPHYCGGFFLLHEPISFI